MHEKIRAFFGLLAQNARLTNDESRGVYDAILAGCGERKPASLAEGQGDRTHLFAYEKALIFSELRTFVTEHPVRTASWSLKTAETAPLPLPMWRGTNPFRHLQPFTVLTHE